MPLGGPPKDFARARLVLVEVRPSELLRLAFRAKASHLGFRGTARYRFDSPAGEFGVVYAAFDLETAFAETVLRTAPQDIPAGEGPILTYEEIARRRVVHLASATSGRALRLVKLYDEGLAAAKVDNRIATDDDYAMTRRWAMAFHEHPEEPDGLVYLSRFMGARRSVVLFDRCADALRRGQVVPLLGHRDFPRVVQDFNLAISRPRRRRT